MDDEVATLLKKHIANLEASVELFKSHNKQRRELWVAKSFLQCLGIPFAPSELVSSQTEPPDVVFRTARFEVKEIMDPGRRRHAEKREELERARAAQSIFELIKPWPFKGITIKKLHGLCSTHTASYSLKYAAPVKHNLDLLLYVNLRNVTRLIGKTIPGGDALLEQGWRSVSFLQGDRACVLAATSKAPAFLGEHVGMIRYRKYGP